MPATDPRVLRTRERVLEAATDILHSEGWDAVTQARVARHAGVGRATVYRHWPEARDLLYEALAAASLKSHIVPSGDVRKDLIGELAAFTTAMTTGQTAQFMTALIDRAEWDTEFESIRKNLADSGCRTLLEILHAGRATGELTAPESDHSLVAQLVGPLVFRRFLTGEPITQQFIIEIVDRVISSDDV